MLVMYGAFALAFCVLAWRVLTFLKSGQRAFAVALSIVAVMLVGVFGLVVQDDLDSARMGRALEPLLERDYPDWTYKDFSY